MHLVVAPGIVRKDNVGPMLADHPADLAPQVHGPLELAVLVAQEHEVLHPDHLAGRTLFALASLGHLLRRRLRIVRSLLSTRDHAVGDMGPGRRDP